MLSVVSDMESNFFFLDLISRYLTSRETAIEKPDTETKRLRPVLSSYIIMNLPGLIKL